MAIHLEDTLKKAEGIFLQLKRAKNLPDQAKEILGFPTASPVGSTASSRTSTPIPPVTPANTPVSGPPPSSHLSVSFSKEQSARLYVSENGHRSGSGATTPDDSSIEILSENCNSSMANMYN